MSVRLMSYVWDFGPNKINHRMVLLAMADFANDDGLCWPSVATLCRKTTLSERTVQGCLRDLERDGWLNVSLGGGSRSSRYTLTPAGYAPVQDVPPRTLRTPPPQDMHPTPARRAPEPLLTINETSEVKKDADEVRCLIEAWASPEATTSFIAYRRKAKGKALTVTAAKRLSTHLRTIFDRGGDTDDALGLAEERGWQTVEADWYFNAKGKANGNANHHNGRSAPEGRDRFLDEIAEVARARPAPRLVGGGA